MIIGFEIGKITLLEVESAVRHLGDHASLRRADDPALLLAFRPDPDRNETGRTVRQNPVGPVLFVCRETASHLHRIHVKPVQDILIDDRQLLNDIVNTDRFFNKSQTLSQRCIARGGYSG